MTQTRACGDTLYDAPHFRWVVLVILCMGMFGYNYCYDNVVALQDQLQSEYGLTNIQYNMLYSVYAFPNAVLPFVGGVIMDKIGKEIVILTFFVLIVIGHGLFILGCVVSYYPLMIVGRFLFGAGSESYAMAISPLICDYFRGKELSLALGLTLALARIGSSVNDVTTFYFYQQTNSIIFAVSVGFILVIICLVLITILLCSILSIESRRSKIDVKAPLLTNGLHQETSDINGNVHEHISKISKIRPRGSSEFDPSITADYYSMGDQAPSIHVIPPIYNTLDDSLQSHQGAAVESMSSRPLSSGRSLTNPLDVSPALLGQTGLDYSSSQLMENGAGYDIDNTEREEEEEGGEGEQFKLSDIKQFDSVYWLLLLNCGLIYGCITPWMNVGADFMRKTFGYSHSMSNTLLMVPYICGGIFTPTLGYLSDRIGKRTQLLFMSCICGVAAHYVFGWSHTTQLFVVILALAALGSTAYGIPTSFYNLMVTIDYLLVGVLTKDGDGKDKYLMVEYFLMGMSLLSGLTVIMLFIADLRTGKRLAAPSLQPETQAERRRLSL